MGQKQSSQANITKINFQPDVEILGKKYDPHYGEIKVVRDIKTKEIWIQKEIVHNTSKAFEEEQAYFNNRVTLKHPNIVSLIGYNSQDKHNFCSTYYKIVLYIENLENNLQTELENRRASKTPFTEEELLLIADDLITALAFFQSQGFSHGDIRPFNIFFKDQVYKLSDPSLSAQKNTNALNLAIVQGTRTLLAPELLVQVPESNFDIKVDPYKADVFSLGATLLSLATLTNSEDFYDYQTGKIDQVLMRERLYNVHQNYSEFTHDLIEDLLTFNETERPDFITIANKIAPHKDYLRRGYHGRTVNISSEQRGEKVKRAAIPTDDYVSGGAGDLEELEARIRAAIRRTEETFRLVRATPGLSGVFDQVVAKHGYPEGLGDTPLNIANARYVESQPADTDRLKKSQPGQDFGYNTREVTTSYNYNVGGAPERVMRSALPPQDAEEMEDSHAGQQASNAVYKYEYRDIPEHNNANTYSYTENVTTYEVSGNGVTGTFNY